MEWFCSPQFPRLKLQPIVLSLLMKTLCVAPEQSRSMDPHLLLRRRMSPRFK